jgi:hypothetical protein
MGFVRRFTVEEKLIDFQIQRLIEAAIDSFPHEECKSCECFLGYLAHLEMDSDESGKELISKYTQDRRKVHSCLGCDPCPPANQYAKYLRDNQSMGQNPSE